MKIQGIYPNIFTRVLHYHRLFSYELVIMIYSAAVVLEIYEHYIAQLALNQKERMKENKNNH